MTGADLGGRRVVALSGSTAAAAVAGCAMIDADPVLVLQRDQLLMNPRTLRGRARAANAEAALIVSSDWERQELPQLLLLAAAAVASRGEAYLFDLAAPGEPVLRRLRRSAALRLPVDALHGAGLMARELGRAPLAPRGRARPATARRAPASVMAIWVGSPDSPVGGSVTHASGILNGMRACGLRVGLVTAGTVPSQLASVVDDVEIIEPLPSAGRLTSDVERVVSNRAIRQAGLRLSQRLPNCFVYQRHRVFLTAGLELARLLGTPFVLEWNSSEVWVRGIWNKPVGVERIFNASVAVAERRVLAGADSVVAVSAPAGEMACRYGATEAQVSVVPNGVDIEVIDRLTRGVEITRPVGARAVIGWIGTFGPWHGAPILVQAMAHLDEGIHLALIGDGQEVAECQRLASELGVSDRIRWLGRLPHDEAIRTLRGCDLLASPHVNIPGERFFGSPTKLFEYMAIGRPTVASELEQIGHILEDGVTARLVPPGDPRALAHAMTDVLESADAGASLAAAAKRVVVEQHTWTHRARVVLESLVPTEA